MNLTELRKNIDIIDFQILKLLKQRMELTLKTKKFKQNIHDPAREEAIISRIKSYSGGLVTSEFSEKLYREIICESKRLQEKNLKLIGFQGEHGAYGEVAAGKFSSFFIPIPSKEFYDVFYGVRDGYLDYGIVPVENSIEGPVNQVNDLLVETELYIVGEVNIPVHHCILAPADTYIEEIKVVYSHPQALGQCRKFIITNGLEGRPFYDTAGAAMMIARERPEACGAIASVICGQLYNLSILKENIQDGNINSTRFFILSREKNQEVGNKCSIIFSTQHRAGTLFSILKIFSERNINLTRLESRPVRDMPDNYAFLLDFHGSDSSQNIIEVMEEVKKETLMFKFLGCYKEDS